MKQKSPIPYGYQTSPMFGQRPEVGALSKGWLYLAMILDLYSRQIVGWAMSDRLTSDFVIKALYQAIGRRRPPLGCIFHSDRGVQYASIDFRAVLEGYGFLQSMSQK